MVNVIILHLRYILYQISELIFQMFYISKKISLLLYQISNTINKISYMNRFVCVGEFFDG